MGIAEKSKITDSMSRTIRDDKGAALGKISIEYNYTQVIEDDYDDEGNSTYKAPDDKQYREDEEFVVRVEDPDGKEQSATVYTGAAMSEIVELFGRLTLTQRMMAS